MSAPERPRSPDAQIYRPQLTSVLSILHRLSGIGLAVGSVLLVVWLASIAAGPGGFHDGVRHFLSSPIGIILLIGWTFALFFHLCNGIRHLGWDLGYGFELRTIYLSGWIVVAASVLLTLIAWIAGCLMAG